MVGSTLIRYRDSDGIERIKVKNSLGAQTSLMDIVTFIESWLWGDFAFDLQINDSDLGLLVDFDDNYFSEHNLYVNQTATSKVQLTVLQTRGKFYSLYFPFFQFHLFSRGSVSKFDTQQQSTNVDWSCVE